VKDFLLRPVRDQPGQRQLFEYSSHAAPALAAEQVYPTLAQQQQQQQEQLLQQEQELQQLEQPVQQQQQQQQQLEQPVQQQQQLLLLRANRDDNSLEAAQATAAALRASCEVLKGPPRSSAADPQGFVGTFFK
jgi:anti-sigma-K factor RskA